MIKNWQIFHTYVDGSEDRVDQISIDEHNKRYILDKNISDLATDSVDKDGNYIYSIDVSRFIFEIIVDAVKQKGFKELKE